MRAKVFRPPVEVRKGNAGYDGRGGGRPACLRAWSSIVGGHGGLPPPTLSSTRGYARKCFENNGTFSKCRISDLIGVGGFSSEKLTSTTSNRKVAGFSRNWAR